MNTHVNVPGYHYTYNGPLAGGTAYDFQADDTAFSSGFTIENTLSHKTHTDYKNHGEFVKQSPDKNDAAHSCIGMPVN